MSIVESEKLGPRRWINGGGIMMVAAGPWGQTPKKGGKVVRITWVDNNLELVSLHGMHCSLQCVNLSACMVSSPSAVSLFQRQSKQQTDSTVKHTSLVINVCTRARITSLAITCHHLSLTLTLVINTSNHLSSTRKLKWTQNLALPRFGIQQKHWT